MEDEENGWTQEILDGGNQIRRKVKNKEKKLISNSQL
jgi:hypothetical protein